MSRVDLIRNGETIAKENFSDPENVVIQLGDQETFRLANWHHLKIKIEEER